MSSDASVEAIRAAYRALAARYHPDRNPGDRDAELKLKRLNAAWAVLGDASKKKLYDELTQSPEAHDERREEPPQTEPSRWKSSEERPPSAPPRWKVPGEDVPAPKSAPQPSRNERVATKGAGGFGRGLAWLFGLTLGSAAFWAATHQDQPNASVDGAPTPPYSQTAAMTGSSTAAAVPNVPPLLPNETPPVDGPNYFEPREMSAGGVVAALESCRSSAHKSGPDLSDDLLSTYCTCFVDAYRRNFHTTGDGMKAMPTASQIQACAAGARSGAPSPFRFTSPRSTTDMRNWWNRCIRGFGEKDHGVYCGCFVDALLALQNPETQVIPQADIARCEAADQYWAATNNNLTVRQFKALFGATAKTAPSRPIPPPKTVPTTPTPSPSPSPQTRSVGQMCTEDFPCGSDSVCVKSGDGLTGTCVSIR